MERAEATSQATATQRSQVQEPSRESGGKAPAGAEAEARPTTTSGKLTRGFAQMASGAMATQTVPASTPQAQETRTASNPPGTEDPVKAPETAEAEAAAQRPQVNAVPEATPADGLSAEERQRRAEQGARDRAQHQQELEAKRQAALEEQREALRQRREQMKTLDDEMLGAQARRELDRQELREQLLEEVRPVIEQQTAQNTRIVVASELIEALGDEETANRIVARSREWQAPADFYAAYHRAVAEGAVKTFREKELPRLLDEARRAGRNQAEAEREDIPLPQFESSLPAARRPTNPADKLSLGLAKLRKER